MDDDVTIAKGYYEGNLYYLQLYMKTSIYISEGKSTLEFKSDHTFKADVETISNYQLWHLWLSHLGTNNLLKMPMLIHGIENITLVLPEPNICEGYIYRK